MNRRTALVLTFLAAYLLSYFFRSTNAVLAGDLQRDAGLGPEQLGFMTSLFFLVFAAAQLPLGAALDRWGPRWVPAGLMLIAAAGSLVTAAADGFAGLALGRALIGLGMAGVLMGALKAFAAWFEPRRFATMSGVFVGLGSLGALGATTPLAALAAGIGWRGVFVAAGIVTALVAALLTVVVRAAPPAAAEDAGSAGTPATPNSAAGAGMRAPAVPIQAAGAGARAPAVGFRTIYVSREFWRLAGMQFAMAGALYGHQGLWGGPFLVRGLDLEVAVAARLLLVLGLAATVGFVVAGPAAGRFGLRRAMGGGALLTLAAVVALALAPPSTSVAALALAWAAFGLGAGLQVLGYDGARSLFPSAAGRAVTAINVFGIGGSALMQMGLGWVVAGASAAMGADPADPPLAAYRVALWTTAAVLALAWLHFVVR
ncbi:MAG: MFS transporter, partial [Trueperaceae bacterium]